MKVYECINKFNNENKTFKEMFEELIKESSDSKLSQKYCPFHILRVCHLHALNGEMKKLWFSIDDIALDICADHDSCSAACTEKFLNKEMEDERK